LPACRVRRAERELSPHAVLCASFPQNPQNAALYSEPSAGVNGRVSARVRSSELFTNFVRSMQADCYARVARHYRLYQRTGEAHRRTNVGAGAAGKPVSVADGGTSSN